MEGAFTVTKEFRLDHFLGNWFDVLSTPEYFEPASARNVKATYKQALGNGALEITNSEDIPGSSASWTTPTSPTPSGIWRLDANLMATAGDLVGGLPLGQTPRDLLALGQRQPKLRGANGRHRADATGLGDEIPHRRMGFTQRNRDRPERFTGSPPVPDLLLLLFSLLLEHIY